MRVSRAGALLGGLVLSGCSLFVSTSGLGGPVVDDGNDGGTPPPDRASGDDAARIDAGTSAPDGAPGEDAGPFCDDTALFCTQMDDGLGVFSETTADPGTTLDVDVTTALSPAKSLLVRTTRTTTTRTTVARRFLPNGSQDVRLRFAMRLEPVDIQAGDRGTHILIVNVGLGNANVNVTFEILPDRQVSVFTTHVATEPFKSLATPIVYGQWHRFEVELAVTKNRLRIVKDGVVSLERTDPVYPTAATAAHVEWALGAVSLNTPHPGIAIRYDDLRADKL